MIDFYPGLKFRLSHAMTGQFDDYTILENNGELISVLCHSNDKILNVPNAQLESAINKYIFTKLSSIKLKNIYIDTKSGPVLIK